MASLVDFTGLTVLLLEDDADTRDVLGEMFCFLGAEVAAYGTVGEAVEAARQRSFDLVVSDIRLGAETGLALAEAIRSSTSPWRLVRMVALSAYSDETSKTEALQAGFDAFVAKMDVTVLIPTAARLLGRTER